MLKLGWSTDASKTFTFDQGWIDRALPEQIRKKLGMSEEELNNAQRLVSACLTENLGPACLFIKMLPIKFESRPLSMRGKRGCQRQNRSYARRKGIQIISAKSYVKRRGVHR